MRLVALCCVLLVGRAALAQPGPDPTPTPPTDPVSAPSPPPAPLTVPAPAPKPLKRSPTEARLEATARCAARDPACDWIATFSSLERQSIRRVLDATQLEPDPAPWGKTIGRIRITNERVFAERNWLRFLNIFHVTTRTQTIKNELTISEGEVWDDERVTETQRRLKDPLYTSIVVVLPVKSPEPGKVDLLVITRDIWSLRLNTKYAIQEATLTDLTVSLSENNFLGRRKTVALGFIMDQGAIAVGPLYIDKNVLGEHFDLRFRVDKILTRQSLDVVTPDGTHIPTGDPEGVQDAGKFRSEGTAATVALGLPLWALASRWGGGVSVSYRNAVSRQYFGTGLRAYDDIDTPDADNLPRQYRMRTWSTRGNVTRQWGKQFKQQLELGYSVSSQRPSLLPTFTFDPVLLDHFRRDVFPRSELVSTPFIEWTFFQAKFGMIRNVDTYELGEDVRFGPSAGVGLSQSLQTLGSDYTFTRPSATAGWTIPWGRDGFARLSAGGQLRIQGGRTIDNTATAQVRAATPTLFGYLRFLGQVHTETRWNDTQNQFYALGAESGLRAYRIGQFIGDRRIVGQVEMRTVPIPIWVVRTGAVVFYEGGGAASSFGQMGLAHDVGFGLRMLIPQTSRELFRFDLAFPLVAAQGTRAGYPRFIAGFDSYF